jgi:hypothetical protein
VTDKMTGEEIDLATIEALAERATKPIVTKVGADLEGIGCVETFAFVVLVIAAIVAAIF